jgi:hypothetical protein
MSLRVETLFAKDFNLRCDSLQVYCAVVSLKYTDFSEVLIASIIRAITAVNTSETLIYFYET